MNSEGFTGWKISSETVEYILYYNNFNRVVTSQQAREIIDRCGWRRLKQPVQKYVRRKEIDSDLNVYINEEKLAMINEEKILGLTPNHR